jgi:hypothetical protein
MRSNKSFGSSVVRGHFLANDLRCGDCNHDDFTPVKAEPLCTNTNKRDNERFSLQMKQTQCNL